MRLSYMKLVVAAVTYWHSARGAQATLGEGVFWTGMQRACSHASRETAPLMLGEMKSLPRRAALGEEALREAVEPKEWGGENTVSGQFADRAVDLRAMASMVIGFFAVRRSLEIAQLVTSDVEVDAPGATVSIRVVQRGNGQLGAGRLAYLVPMQAWVKARTVKVPPGWTWFRNWLKENKD